VTLVNDSGFRITSGPPYPFNVSYYWIEAVRRKGRRFDGVRTHLFPGLEAGQTACTRVPGHTPSRPGRYVLRVTLVQEGVAWVDDESSRAFADCNVRVV
jgi:hypothetical protein